MRSRSIRDSRRRTRCWRSSICSNSRLDAARTEFEGMVKRDPSAVGPRTMVGVILETQGKREEARRWYEATVAEMTERAGRGQQSRLHLRRTGNEAGRGAATGEQRQTADAG